MPSPYDGIPVEKWSSKTDELIKAHPLKPKEIVEVVLQVWKALFTSAIGKHKIGEHIFPKPQIMGFFLQELIALEFASRYPNKWRGEMAASEKDLVYVPNLSLSVEIKTSSHKTQVFGNRSYAQEETDPKKTKSGYYIAVNFEKFDGRSKPAVNRIRFGWLDHSDWLGQKSATGQQARIKPESELRKLKLLFDKASGLGTEGDLFDLDADA